MSLFYENLIKTIDFYFVLSYTVLRNHFYGGKLMKKLIFPIFSGLLLTFILIFSILAYGGTSTVRIGLVSSFKDITSVSVGSQTVVAGFSSSNSFNEIAYLDLSDGASVTKSTAYYIAVEGSFSTYEEAKTYSQGLTGYNAMPAYKGGVWNVYIGPYESLERAQTAVSNYPYPSVLCAPSATSMYISSPSNRMIYDFSGANFAITSERITNLGSSSYRGYIEFYPTGGAAFTCINVLPLETYLCGVVPSEMPSTWNAEALKAQATAARTYAENRLSSGIEDGNGYDLCDTDHCQVYSGTAAEAESSTAAVNATAGQVITYDGALINAVYSACSGGVTDDNINVWGTDTPYLKSVKDIEGTEFVEWSRSFTFSQLSNLLAANGVNIGSVVYVSIERSDNGRVCSMTFSGNTGTYTIEKEAVRTFFSATEEGSLKSRVFDIEFEFNEATGEFTLIIDGKGWGHGLGLSQYGANSMAAAGYTYDEILKHYYTGVEITSY